MKMTLIVSAVVIGIGLGVSCADEPQQPAKEAAAVKKQTVCPVMGGQINEKVYADAEGKRVYFCCAGCPAEFNKAPAKYIAKMEKDGVTLEKAPVTPVAKPATDAKVEPVQKSDKQACEGGGCCK